MTEMSASNRKRETADKLLYYDLLFSTLLSGYDRGIILEDLLEETADILAWEKGLATIEIDTFVDEVKDARDLNRKFIEMGLDVDWKANE